MKRLLTLVLIASLTAPVSLAQTGIEAENRSAVEFVVGRSLAKLAEQVPPQGERVLVLPIRGDDAGFTRDALVQRASQAGFTVASGLQITEAMGLEQAFFERLATLDLADAGTKLHLAALGEVDGYLWGWVEQKPLLGEQTGTTNITLALQYHDAASGRQVASVSQMIPAPLTRAAGGALILVGVLVLVLVIIVAIIGNKLRKRAMVKALRAKSQSDNEIDLALNEDRELRNRIVREVSTARQVVREAELAAGDKLEQADREQVRQSCDRLETFAATVERAEFGNARRFKDGKLPTSALEQLADFTRTLDALSHDIGVEATGLSTAVSGGKTSGIKDCCKQLEKAMTKLSGKFSERLDYLRGL